MRPRRHREGGAAAVELALLLPVLLLIIGGIIDFGRFFYTQNIVVNAAREGARMLALGYPSTGAAPSAEARMNDALLGLPPLSSPGAYNWATPAVCPANPTATDSAQVTIEYTGFKWFVLGPIAGSAKPNGKADMR